MPFQSPGHATQEDLDKFPESSQDRTTHHAAQQAAVCPTDDDTHVPKKSKKIDKQSTEYIVKSGIAGGLAGCAAKTVVGPLDRVKILFQASNPEFAKYTGSWTGVVRAMKDIYGENGARGLFRGHSATLLRIFPYAGIKFLAYEQVRALFIKDKSQETPLRRLASGSVSGCISVFCTYPLEVIRVRLAFETKSSSKISLREICSQIYHERPPSYVSSSSTPMPKMSAAAVRDPVAAAAQVAQAAAASAEKAAGTIVPQRGLANFYRGFTPTLWGMLPYAGFSFLTHDVMGDLLRNPQIAHQTTIPGTATEKKPAQLTTWAELVAGGMAGFVSQTASYPLEVIRRRMQVGGAVGDGHRLRMGEVARDIWTHKGWRGFFIGLGIGYFKVIPMAATSFFVYERGKYLLGI